MGAGCWEEGAVRRGLGIMCFLGQGGDEWAVGTVGGRMELWEQGY